jgi:microcystin-dependent protein
MARTRFTVKEGISVADDNAVGGYPLIPVGALMPYAGATAPDGWLLCNGQTPSRITYANLFAVIGTTYGAGDGSTFGLPDPMGRAIIGVGSGSGLTARALAAKSGAETVVIGSANLPTHNHTLSAHTHTSAAHSHTLSGHTHGITINANSFDTGTVSADHSHSGTTGNASGDHAHNLPRALIATAGTNRAVVSANPTQATLFTEGQNATHNHGFSTGGISANHSHNANHGHTGSSGAPSSDATNSVTPNATGGPSSDTTGDGGFTNTALALMNPFLALNYIIKY